MQLDKSQFCEEVETVASHIASKVLTHWATDKLQFYQDILLRLSGCRFTINWMCKFCSLKLIAQEFIKQNSQQKFFKETPFIRLGLTQVGSTPIAGSSAFMGPSAVSFIPDLSAEQPVNPVSHVQSLFCSTLMTKESTERRLYSWQILVPGPLNTSNFFNKPKAESGGAPDIIH